jgi:hypothetical protein
MHEFCMFQWRAQKRQQAPIAQSACPSRLRNPFRGRGWRGSYSAASIYTMLSQGHVWSELYLEVLGTLEVKLFASFAIQHKL